MMRSNPWWSFADHPVAARRTVDALFSAYYAGLAVTGVVTYLVHPSPGMQNALEPWGTHVWSVGTAASATLALVCRARRACEAETVALAVLSALTFLHGVLLVLGTPGMGGLQTGLRLIVAPLMMFAVVGMLRHPTVRVPYPPPRRTVEEGVE